MATLAEMLAAAKAQIGSSGDDNGPMEKLIKGFNDALESQNTKFKDAISDLERRVSDNISGQVVEGQAKLRNEIQRKGGWSTLDQGEMISRLIDPAGLTLEQKLVMPEYQLKKYLAPDMVEKVKIFQELNDDAMLLGWILATRDAKGGGFTDQDVKSCLGRTKTWKTLQSVVKTITTTANAGAGAEWMPTSFSSQLVDVITVSLKVAAQFSRIAIPTNTFKVPIATTDDVAFLVAETTDSNLLNQSNEYPKFVPGTDNVSFNAIKLAAIVVFSDEAEEDSIIPMLPFLKMKIANSMANAQERATLDGDTTATHQDNDVSSATDARKAWNGLRMKALTATATTKDLGTFNLDNVRGLRELLSAQFSENPDNMFYATSVKVMLKMLKFPEFLTLDKFGPNATIVKGQIGNLDGSPVLTSKYSRDNVAATGVNTAGGPNTKSLLYLQNKLGFWYGDKRTVTIDSARMIMSGLGFMVISQRLDFKDIYKVGATSNRHGALGINI